MISQQAHNLWSRRAFLKASLLGMALIGSRLALPDWASAQALPEGRLRLFNVNSQERLTVRYRNRSGPLRSNRLTGHQLFLRCFHSDQVCQMDVQLLEYLNQIVSLVGQGKEVRVFSAYRSPTYNNLLVRLGRGAVPKSLHTTGQAMDIAIPGVRLSQVRRTAQMLKLGGVGNYARRGFIHLDTGAVRYW